MPASNAPRQIVLDAGEQTLHIAWADAHASAYPLDALRRSCPCASCMGGHEQMGQLPEREIFLLPSLMRWEKVRLEPVGGYGVRFVWDDGHDAGIHTWERLRAICPCAVCASTYGDKR